MAGTGILCHEGIVRHFDASKTISGCYGAAWWRHEGKLIFLWIQNILPYEGIGRHFFHYTLWWRYNFTPWWRYNSTPWWRFNFTPWWRYIFTNWWRYNFTHWWRCNFTHWWGYTFTPWWRFNFTPWWRYRCTYLGEEEVLLRENQLILYFLSGLNGVSHLLWDVIDADNEERYES